MLFSFLLPISSLQAVGQVLYLQQYAYDPSPTWAFSAVTGLTLGAVAVVLLGDRISDLKLGNGTSLHIFTNIVSYLPASIGRTFAEASQEGNVGGEAGLLVCFLLLVFGIVYVQVRGERGIVYVQVRGERGIVYVQVRGERGIEYVQVRGERGIVYMQVRGGVGEERGVRDRGRAHAIVQQVHGV